MAHLFFIFALLVFAKLPGFGVAYMQIEFRIMEINALFT